MPRRKRWRRASGRESTTRLRTTKTFEILGAYSERTVIVDYPPFTLAYAPSRDEQEKLERLFEAQTALATRIVREYSVSVKAAQARQVFDWLEVVFPRRVTSEEIGDALEIIHGLATDPECSRPGLKIAVKTVTTIFWVVLNSIRLISSSILGKKAE
jgi:hypothetical protein